MKVTSVDKTQIDLPEGTAAFLTQLTGKKNAQKAFEHFEMSCLIHFIEPDRVLKQLETDWPVLTRLERMGEFTNE